MMKHYNMLAAVWAILITNTLFAQTTTVSGTVTSKADNVPLAGVTVIVAGTGEGTKTATDGTFALNAPEKATVTFSSVGYQPQQITVNGSNTSLNISLEVLSNSLNEVVVTALGISKQKKSLGYAVQELKSKDFSEAKEPNLVNALEGKIAGVRVTNSQGDMGSARIVIRGETSISGNNQPLFVVDGVPVDNSQLGAGGSRDYANAIADLNPEDIETISVLKGPNAAALYGSRAAHGVVLIKTKTGKRQKGLGISLNSNTTFSNLLILPKYQNVFGQGANGQFSYVDGKGGGVNDGVDESWGPKLDGRLIPQFFSNGEAVPFVAHPDNVKDYFRTGVILNNGIAIANAGDKFDYRVSYNNFKQKGIIPNSELNKHSVALNATFQIHPKLSVTTTANYFVDDAPNLPGSGGKRSTSTMLQLTWFGRQVDVNQLRNYRDASGNTFNWNNSYYSNPFFVAYENTVQQRRDRLIGNVGLTYKILPFLSANFRSGTDYYTDRRKLKIAYGTNGTPFGSYEEDAYTINENNTEGTLSFSKSLATDLSLDVLAGGNIRTKTYSENIQRAPRLAVAGVYTLANSRDPLVSSSYFSKLKQFSMFSSAQLGFCDYAFINLTARNDRSSTLPAENLSYFYPSINGSIIVTDAFGIKSDVLSYAKLRGGWSKVGSDADPYLLANTYNFNAPFNSNPQLTATGKNLNPELKSESTTSAEIGAEAAFFKNRARLDMSLYNTNSYNQILFVDVSATTGYSSQLLNAGKINNKGVELQLGVTPVKAAAFTWDVNLNYASNRSKVVELDKEGRLQNYVLGSYLSMQVLAAVGQPYGTLYGNAFLRDASGTIIVNGDGLPVADPSKKVLGKYTPDWTGGITNSFTYKGISLGVLIDASYGGSIYAGTNATGTYTGVLAATLPGRDAEHGGLTYYYPGNVKTNDAVQLTGSTTPPGGETIYDDGMIYPGVTADGKQNQKIIPASSYYKATSNIDEAVVYDASFVKLREVRLSYALPANWISRIGFAGASVSLVGRNLWIIHKNVPNIDPETAFTTGNAQGLEDLSIPTARTYGFNINLKF